MAPEHDAIVQACQALLGLHYTITKYGCIE